MISAIAYYIHVIPGWIELISLAFCVGVLVCSLWVVPFASHSWGASLGNAAERLRRSFGVAIVVLLVCNIVVLLVRTSEMGGRGISETFPLLCTVALKTHFGRAWLTRVVAVVLLYVLLRSMRPFPSSRALLVFMLGLTVVISATASATGHASDAGDFSVPEIMDWLHLFAASVWGGGLIVLSFVVLPVLAGSPEPKVFAAVSKRFSRIAGPAVGVVAATALYNGFSYVGSIEALWKAVYGWSVMTKIFLFFLLVNLGGLHRYVNVPLLQEWAGASPESRGILTRVAVRLFPGFTRGGGQKTASRFVRGVRAEALLIILVLLCAALLRHEIPARHLSHVGHVHIGGAPMHMDGGGTMHNHADQHNH
jgi:putative copper resistance protein D